MTRSKRYNFEVMPAWLLWGCGAMLLAFLPGLSFGQAGDAATPSVPALQASVESEAVPATQPAREEGSPDAETREVETPASSRKAVDLTPPHQPWSHYEVIAQRNMFTKGSAGSNRPRPNPEGNQGGSTTRPGRPASATWVLTGVVVREADSVAFFENTASGMTLRVVQGQSVANLALVKVLVDRVELQAGQDEIRQVRVGATVDGSSATFSSGGGSSIFGDADAVAPASGGSASGGGGSEAQQSVIERMRARRAQERGGQ